jgi:hypothetical protein
VYGRRGGERAVAVKRPRTFMAGSHSQLVELGKFLSEVLRWLVT